MTNVDADDPWFLDGEWDLDVFLVPLGLLEFEWEELGFLDFDLEGEWDPWVFLETHSLADDDWTVDKSNENSIFQL